MCSDELHSTAFSEEDAAEVLAYHAVSKHAVLGLVLGLFSWLAFFGTGFWLLAIAGAILSLVALKQIDASEGALAGRPAAQLGLALSLVFAAAAPSKHLMEVRLMTAEARPVADLWFQFLRNDEPQKAHQLTEVPRVRQENFAGLWEYYGETPEARSKLQTFVANDFIRTMLALGSKAEARYWTTEEYINRGSKKHVTVAYAITYPDQSGRKTTFFARLMLTRTVNPNTHVSEWRVEFYQGGIRPHEIPEADGRPIAH